MKLVGVSYHSAAERPEPPQEEQSKEEEQRQQGDQENGAIELEGTHKHTMLEHYDKCTVHIMFHRLDIDAS